MSNSPSICWFRLDLRLDDHPALRTAIDAGGPIVPLFIWSPEEEGEWSPGAASRWWLHQSLVSFDQELRRLGSRLIVRRGPAEATLRAVIEETGAKSVFWSCRYEPAIRQRGEKIEAQLNSIGVNVRYFQSSLLFDPSKARSTNGKPFQVFTPFWRACLQLPEPDWSLAAPTQIPPPKNWPASIEICDLNLEPTIDWVGGLRETWRPGEIGAQVQLERFIASGVAKYSVERDRPDLPGTSRLSPHLHFGEISIRRVWHAIRSAVVDKAGPAMSTAADVFLREIGWREFAYYLLTHFPETTLQPLRKNFARFPWRDDSASLRRWQRGETGYPLVDAGMRELWHTGWMHNRVRMVVASFLVKHLLLPWQEGERWFWDTLVDADLANNTLGWQWTAGCGADAAPFFRIFNPVTQGEKFDPKGNYIRRWVPELAKLSSTDIHAPWNAPPIELAAAGVKLGITYPLPIVDHKAARERAWRHSPA